VNGTTTVGASVFFGGIEQRDVCHGQPRLVVHLLLPASPDFPRSAVWVTGTLSRGRIHATMPMTDNGTANTVPVTFDLDFVATGAPFKQAGTTHEGRRDRTTANSGDGPATLTARRLPAPGAG